MYKTLETLSFREIIGYSIDGEEKAAEFYQNLADKLSELMAKRYESLARDEEIHKRELIRLHKTLFGTEDYVVPDKKGLPPHEGHVEVESVANLIDSLNRAIQNERNAYKLYRYVSKTHPEHSKLFQYLAIMEKGHEESLVVEKRIYEGGTYAEPEIRDMDPQALKEFQLEKWRIH
ncbi:MAG: ferritin family protein [Thermoplasmata archaeon]